MTFAKEPRQLMISLMYLVLIAMLALNVSSEIIHAFYRLDETMERSNITLDNVQEDLIIDLEEIVQTKTQYIPLIDAMKQISTIAQDFNEYIDSLRVALVEESGGYYSSKETKDNPVLVNKPKYSNNKDVPQRMFVTGDYGTEQRLPKGIELDRKIQRIKQQFIKLIHNLWNNGGIKGTMFADTRKREAALARVLDEIALEGSENYVAAQNDNRSWVEYTFGHMPVAAIYPMLRKFQNDGKLTELNLISFLAAQIGRMGGGYDKYNVLVGTSQSYILLGDSYESEIALGVYNQHIRRFNVLVNGRKVPVIDGKARYSTYPNRLGKHSYHVDYEILNPLTQKVDTIISKDFYYEVGLPSTVASADRMNVVYIGVENPVTIVKPKTYTQVYLEGEGNIEHKKDGKYFVKVNKAGKTNLVVANPTTGHKIPFVFYKKPIPQPNLQLGGYTKSDGEINKNVFQQQKSLKAVLKDFDFDATCHVQSFYLYHIPKREDAIEYSNEGSSFSKEILHAIQQASDGDQYIFTNAKAICPGDKAGRYISSLSFQIK